MTIDTHNTINEYRRLRKDSFYPFDQKKVEEWILEKKDEILEKQKRFDQLKKELDKISTEDIEQCKKNLLLSIKKSLEQTSNSKLGYPLSRNQGTIISNYIFGKVLGILESAIDSGIGFGYSQFYFEKNGDFDAANLIALLKEFSNKLRNKNFVSFLELESFYDTYKGKILDLWEKENKEHLQSRD